jgi:hypothetical protein
MPKSFPFYFSLAGVNPRVFLLCQIIWIFNNFINRQTIDDSVFRQSLLAILGDLQVVPFFTSYELQQITIFSGTLKVLLQFLVPNSDDGRVSFRFTSMILRRILNRMILQVGAHELKRCMHLLTTYVAHSRVHPALIQMSDCTLEFVKKSSYLDKRWFFLLSQFSEPRALGNLKYSANPDIQLAILCREFRKLFVSKNQVFFVMFEYSSYVLRKRRFFELSRTRCFKTFNKSFRLLERMFRYRLPMVISYYDIVEEIIALFLELMNDTQPSTWQFLSMAFSEDSSENLEALRQADFHQEPYDFYQELDGLTTIPFHYPKFSLVPCDASLKMFQRIKVVYSLPDIPHSLLEISRSMTRTYYDTHWKSVWACGLDFILSLALIIQRGDPFLNFVLHSVVNEERSSFYKYFLDLFLKANVMTEEHSKPEIVKFWIDFREMQWKYLLFLKREFSFSQILMKFLEILENPQFFRGITCFCSQTFCSKQAFEADFFQFCQTMRNSPTEDSFAVFFYPRVFEICRKCGAKIRYSRQLKRLKLCEDCVCPHKWTPGLSDDDD